LIAKATATPTGIPTLLVTPLSISDPIYSTIPFYIGHPPWQLTMAYLWITPTKAILTLAPVITASRFLAQARRRNELLLYLPHVT
jgi:hypothetical protein